MGRSGVHLGKWMTKEKVMGDEDLKKLMGGVMWG